MYQQQPFNQFGGGFAQPQYGQPFGAMPQQTMFKDIKVTNPMTKEDLELLKPLKDEFSMHIDPKDTAKAKCPHKDSNGLLVKPVTGNIVECTQCHEQFDITIRTKEEVEAAVENVISFLNQMKLYAINFDTDFYKDYMMMIPLLRKAPQLYEIAVRNFSEVARQTNGQAINPTMNPAFNKYGIDAYQDIFHGNYGQRYNVYNQQFAVYPQGMMGQPVPQQGYYDPNMMAQQMPPQQVAPQMAPQMNQQFAPNQMPQQQQPVFAGYTQQPQMQAPVAPAMNPFANGAYTAPMAMQAPQMATPQPVAPQAPQQQAEATTETKITV